MSIVFDKALEIGLRAEEDALRNEQSLAACTNLCATPRRLRAFTALTEPFDSADYTAWGVTKTWPFPQLIRCNAKTLLMGEDTIHTIDEDDWTATAATLRKTWTTLGTTYGTITKGGRWHVADFYDRVFLFNGKCVLFEDFSRVSPAVFGWMVQSAVTINTGCAHREGRMFYAGFDKANYYEAAGWESYLETLLTSATGAFDGLSLGSYIDMDAHGPGPNWVWWSSIGGGDVHWLFKGDTAYDGEDLAAAGPFNNYDTASDRTDPYWVNLLARNEAGLRPMPFRGMVQKMIPLGANVVVYGADGIAALRSANSPDSTYGLHTFPEIGTRVGVADRDAAAGGDGGHFFIDEEGVSWFVNPDMSIQRLGHKEFFSGMLDSDIVVSYDERNREFWIADGTDCYVRTSTGLSKAPWMPTTVSFAEGGNVGVKFAVASPSAVGIVTQPFDGGSKGIFEVYEVRLATTDTHTTGWQVAIDWRVGKADSWTRSTAVTCDTRGIARVKVTGMEFRIVLTHADRTKADLERIEVELRDGRNSIKRVVDA